MSPDDIKQLRQALNCTARELATALKLDQKDVLSWEAGDTFPTKRYVLQMEALRQRGPQSIPRKPRGKAKQLVGLKRLEDPKLWELVRKLAHHPDLFEQAYKLASKYDEPDES